MYIKSWNHRYTYTTHQKSNIKLTYEDARLELSNLAVRNGLENNGGVGKLTWRREERSGRGLVERTWERQRKGGYDAAVVVIRRF